jgi:hypothetical protein
MLTTPLHLLRPHLADGGRALALAEWGDAKTNSADLKISLAVDEDHVFSGKGKSGC